MQYGHLKSVEGTNSGMATTPVRLVSVGSEKPQKKTVGLCMIVKNEKDVIARCMRNVAPIIDHFVIVDTGSTDGTQDIILKTGLELGIPGEVHERNWVNFGHNRSEAIRLAESHTDYLFFIDADEILRLPEGFSLPDLTADRYAIVMDHGSTRYERVCLVKSSCCWRYEGVLHEYLASDTAKGLSVLIPGWSVLYTTEGARSKNPYKYRDDALVFEAELEKDPLNSRNWFYLGQSWRDFGDRKRAIEGYRMAASLSSWDEERFYALFETARQSDFGGFPESAVVPAYLRAYEDRPSRAEPLVWLAAYFRFRNRFVLGLTFIEMAMKKAPSNDRLFVLQDCYGWRRHQEYAQILTGLGRKAEAAKIWQEMIDHGMVTDPARISEIRGLIQALA